jgi:hypothetical protein
LSGGKHRFPIGNSNLAETFPAKLAWNARRDREAVAVRVWLFEN